MLSPTAEKRDSRPDSVAPRVPILPRDVFLRQFAKDYSNGQHVTLLGPTQRGKTTLAFQMLNHCISPTRKTTILSGKPPGRDPVMMKAAQTLNLRVVDEWPPIWNPRDRKRNGFVCQPLQTMRDLKADEDNIRENYRRALLDAYSGDKPNIIFVDEAYHVYHDLGLKREYEAPLVRGAPICGEWSLLQRGVYMTYHAYSAPEYIIFFNDPDLPNVERYAKMVGGVDPKFITAIVKGLRTYTMEPAGNTISEALFIKRAGPQIAIIDVK